MNNDKLLHERRCVIAGASRGLGLATAKAFLAQGAHVCLCARKKDTMTTVRRELEAAHKGQIVAAFGCDVSIQEEAVAFTEYCRKMLGKVDVLVCNAGTAGPIGAVGPTLSAAQWIHCFQTNVMSAIYLCNDLLADMKKRPGSKIILLGGSGSVSAKANMGAYGASKAAVARLAETMSLELAESKLDVNCVLPGDVNTGILDQIIDGDPKATKHMIQEALQQKKKGGDSLDDVTGLLVYLASRVSDGVTGKLVSARWDKWASLHERLDVLKATDAMTLRRVEEPA